MFFEILKGIICYNIRYKILYYNHNVKPKKNSTAFYK